MTDWLDELDKLEKSDRDCLCGLPHCNKCLASHAHRTALRNDARELIDAAHERDELRAAIREAYEAWCGSELAQNPVALTATEAYTHKVLNDVLEPIRRALK